LKPALFRTPSRPDYSKN